MVADCQALTYHGFMKEEVHTSQYHGDVFTATIIYFVINLPNMLTSKVNQAWIQNNPNGLGPCD